jgi:hypothetical protein
MAMTLMVPQSNGNFLTRWATTGFSGVSCFQNQPGYLTGRNRNLWLLSYSIDATVLIVQRPRSWTRHLFVRGILGCRHQCNGTWFVLKHRCTVACLHDCFYEFLRLGFRTCSPCMNAHTVMTHVSLQSVFQIWWVGVRRGEEGVSHLIA